MVPSKLDFAFMMVTDDMKCGWLLEDLLCPCVMIGGCIFLSQKFGLTIDYGRRIEFQASIIRFDHSVIRLEPPGPVGPAPAKRRFSSVLGLAVLAKSYSNQVLPNRLWDGKTVLYEMTIRHILSRLIR